MKKLLNLATLTVLSSGLVTSNLTSQVTNTMRTNNKKINQSIQANQNPFINEITMFKDKDIKKFYVDSNNILWICTKTGLYKSSDGINFQTIKLDVNFPNIIDIVLDSLGNYYVSADNMFIEHSKPEITVYKSSDGITFNRVFTTAQHGYNGVLSCTYQGIYLATAGQIFVSSNEKDDWVDLYDFSSDDWSVNGLIMEEALASTSKGIYYSDTNFSFNKSTLILQSNVRNLFKHKNKIYALGENSDYYVATSQAGKKPSFTHISTTGTDGYSLSNMIIDDKNNVWALANEQLFKSTDGTNFNLASNWTAGMTMNQLIVFKNTIFLGGSHGVFKTNNSDQLFLDMAVPDYQGPQYNGLIFKKEQTINIKADYIKTVVFDGSPLLLPTTNLKIDKSNNGKHKLVLTLKDDIKNYSLLFKNSNSKGEITFNFLIKSGINPENEVSYETNTGDTDLLTGLISDAGNTNGKPIINTRSKNGSSHSAMLNININSDLIDLTNSYYILGNVDKDTNDFKESGSRTVVTNNLTIKNDGIYMFHLVDLLGNIYESYLELGQDNWKLKGTFNDSELKALSEKLNVTADLTNPEQKQQALSWLHKYETDVVAAVKSSIQNNSRGFDIDETSFQGYYKQFLGAVTYKDSNTKEDIKTNTIDKIISDVANNMLHDGLKDLPNLNVNTINVVDKNTLESYTNWINGYQKYIKENKEQWFNKIINIVSRGFASEDEINIITDHLKNLPLTKYLQNITWTPEKKGIGASSDYLQFVELDKLQNDINDFVIKQYPDINTKFEQAITKAENSVITHGYSLEQLLNGKQLPQTKEEIDNFSRGKSFQQWLQDVADSKYNSWRLTMGLTIGVPLALVTAGVAIFLYWRFSKKYKPYNTKEINNY